MLLAITGQYQPKVELRTSIRTTVSSNRPPLQPSPSSAWKMTSKSPGGLLTSESSPTSVPRPGHVVNPTMGSRRKRALPAPQSPRHQRPSRGLANIPLQRRYFGEQRCQGVGPEDVSSSRIPGIPGNTDQVVPSADIASDCHATVGPRCFHVTPESIETYT